MKGERRNSSILGGEENAKLVWLGCGSAGCVIPEGPRPGPSRGMVVVSLAQSPKAICTEFLEYRNHSRSSSTNNANHVADENYDFQLQPSEQLNPSPRTRFKKTWHEKFFKVDSKFYKDSSIFIRYLFAL